MNHKKHQKVYRMLKTIQCQYIWEKHYMRLFTLGYNEESFKQSVCDDEFRTQEACDLFQELVTETDWFSSLREEYSESLPRTVPGHKIS